jgi:hypothetical protein
MRASLCFFHEEAREAGALMTDIGVETFKLLRQGFARKVSPLTHHLT